MITTLKIDKYNLIQNILIADSFFARLKGYMFQKKPNVNGILFKNCNSLHSYFMNFDLDLYFLDKDYHLIGFELGFSKNRTIYVKEGVHVLETPKGTIDDKYIFVGQTFTIY